ncbi:hypothetical protein HHK36_028673 [Tetracentron sinense]|uniref:EF-hand domain-containing protein n=1 Tax=Tetracentron sinense TaxID=13715 RepID=A0A835D2U3_TETSI|nr:hypothetical protein HHK36_028673 [Tetracentron sinense]
MVEEDSSDPDTGELGENWSSEEVETRSNGGDKGVSGYENQRLSRIRENMARLEALGLPKLASSFLGSVKKQPNRKGKEKKDEDDEYRPSDGEDRVSSSSEEDNDEEDSKVRDDGSSGSRRATACKVVKNKNSLKTGKAKMKNPVQKHVGDFIDDDDALRQAIALSLEDSAEVSGGVRGGPSQSSNTHVANAVLNERKGGARIQEDTGRRKRRKSITSRVQMTEDEVIVHFFQFDEAGKGNITVRDLQRVATAHDFSWTDKELVDMIRSFDSDGDGKLSLDDFRKIISRCNMIQSCENAAMGLKS